MHPGLPRHRRLHWEDAEMWTRGWERRRRRYTLGSSDRLWSYKERDAKWPLSQGKSLESSWHKLPPLTLSAGPRTLVGQHLCARVHSPGIRSAPGLGDTQGGDRLWSPVGAALKP